MGPCNQNAIGSGIVPPDPGGALARAPIPYRRRGRHEESSSWSVGGNRPGRRSCRDAGPTPRCGRGERPPRGSGSVGQRPRPGSRTSSTAPATAQPASSPTLGWCPGCRGLVRGSCGSTHARARWFRPGPPSTSCCAVGPGPDQDPPPPDGPAPPEQVAGQTQVAMLRVEALRDRVPDPVADRGIEPHLVDRD